MREGYMKKNLPKVFQNTINKELKNNESIYYSLSKNNDLVIKKSEKKEYEEIVNNSNIEKKINDIFTSSNYVYKAKVDIKTSNSTINTRIIGRNKEYIITFDNKKIPIKDIIDIKETK